MSFAATDRAALAQGRSMAVPAGFISTDLQIQTPAVSSTATQKPKNQSPDSRTYGCCCTQSTFLPPLFAASGASPAAEGIKSAHSDAHLSRPVSQQWTSSALNLLATISAVRNSLNSSSALTEMLHEIT